MTEENADPIRKPMSLPATLAGITAVIAASTDYFKRGRASLVVSIGSPLLRSASV